MTRPLRQHGRSLNPRSPACNALVVAASDAVVPGRFPVSTCCSATQSVGHATDPLHGVVNQQGGHDRNVWLKGDLRCLDGLVMSSAWRWSRRHGPSAPP